MLSSEQQDMLALYGVPGVGAKMHARLLDRFGTPDMVLAASIHELTDVEGIGEKTAASIVSFDRETFIRDQIERMDACGAVLVMKTDEAYPPLLAAFRSAPPVLFVRGDIGVVNRSPVAFVGTRHPTAYGERITRTLVSGCAAHGMCIVSGMAAGIDTVAHHAAIESGGTTAAVFGCGVDVIYPASNRELAETITESGCLISHFPMGTPAQAGNFPARNAVVAGLTLGTVVVEAPQKSGALITAELTVRAGRRLMTVPGNADSPASTGANRLMAEGALPVLTPADIMTALGTGHSGSMNSVTATAASDKPVVMTNRMPMPEGLPGEILTALADGPCQIEEIAERLDAPIAGLLNELTMLEMNGHIIQRPGKLFERR